MNVENISFIFSLFFLNLTYSTCTLTEVWNRFMTVSCEFAPDVQKFLPHSDKHERNKRSIFDKTEPNFDNPQELFDYLYPLANFKQEDLEYQTSQRSSQGFHSSPIYTWVTDLGTLWVTGCKERDGRTQNTEELNKASRRRRSALSGQGSSGYQNRTRSSTSRQKHGNGEILDRKLSISKGTDNSTTTTTTAAPETTTTPDPGNSDTNFFTSYGGDIEYFFPLISFGIPFDGEITFLGFHGFKGLFPY